MIDVVINGKRRRGLLDTGCSRTILSNSALGYDCRQRINRKSHAITMMNGSEQSCGEVADVSIEIKGQHVQLNCLVSDILQGTDVLLGMDLVVALGGVEVGPGGQVAFPKSGACLAASHSVHEGLTITNDDFSATFEDGEWTVAWRWKDDKPPVLKNSIAEYTIRDEVRRDYEAELQIWRNEGWLKPFHGQAKGLIPLMAVEQRNKKKVRPVLDFREMNQYVVSHTADSDVCEDRLRDWRRRSGNAVLIDLKKAYLQLRVDPSLWEFQTVRIGETVYALTRLGFGLSVAPRIMTAVINQVLAMDPEVRRGASSYVDDILVDEDVVSSERVISLLQKFGLEIKEAVPLRGSRVLGLRISEKNGRLVWSRDNELDAFPATATITKREVFSICGRLLGHYPVAGWLRTACSFVKRLASDGAWDSPAPEVALRRLRETLERVRVNDPVQGEWLVGSDKRGRVWCDASSIALGAALEINEVIVEDAAWMRKCEDVHHINVAELEAALKGVNMAVKWALTSLEIVTDSATVASWLSVAISNDERIKVRGQSEMLVKRRLSVLIDTANECGLQLSVTRVASSVNKADALTRVPKEWLTESCNVAIADDQCEAEIWKSHSQHHFGAERTFAILKLERPELNVTMREVKSVIKACSKCKSIDPASISYSHGTLDVEETWKRIACDVTHVNGIPYLSVIDCGPSRFTVWHELQSEEAREVSSKLFQLFCVWGPPEEVLLDNAASFRSQQVKELCAAWGVALLFRCAYRPQGNAIIERCHRTVKRTVARAGRGVLEAVFWYNFAPRESSPAPSDVFFSRRFRSPRARPRPPEKHTSQKQWELGEEVYVKPANARCSTEWRRGRVTGWRPPAMVEVDGMPRHVSHVRPVSCSFDAVAAEENTVGEDDANSSEEGDDHQSGEGNSFCRARPVRDRRPPRWLEDFVTSFDSSDGDD